MLSIDVCAYMETHAAFIFNKYIFYECKIDTISNDKYFIILLNCLRTNMFSMFSFEYNDKRKGTFNINVHNSLIPLFKLLWTYSRSTIFSCYFGAINYSVFLHQDFHLSYHKCKTHTFFYFFSLLVVVHNP